MISARIRHKRIGIGGVSLGRPGSADLCLRIQPGRAENKGGVRSTRAINALNNSIECLVPETAPSAMQSGPLGVQGLGWVAGLAELVSLL